MDRSKQHVTLQQIVDQRPNGDIAYVVIETKNTITYPIGDVLRPRDVESLARLGIPFTVKGGNRQ